MSKYLYARWRYEMTRQRELILGLWRPERLFECQVRGALLQCGMLRLNVQEALIQVGTDLRRGVHFCRLEIEQWLLDS